MTSKRPTFLDLSKISLPLPALTSICHRISGLFLALSMPFIALLFYLSLKSETGFLAVTSLKGTLSLGSLWLWAFLLALSYHFYAGVRHLLMDLHFFEELGSARWSAKVLFALFFLEAVVLTLWFWEII